MVFRFVVRVIFCIITVFQTSILVPPPFGVRDSHEPQFLFYLPFLLEEL